MDNSAAVIDKRLVEALPPGSLYAVGGRVRDDVRTELDGCARAPKDLDYVVVGVDYDELASRLRTLGAADVVGASFAVVKATVDGTSIDVALPRRERSTGIGHRDFLVESGPQVPLADDLARRDFRMNMLARALPGGELVDPYGGRADITARRIDVLHAASFEEDPLRLLRACQFAARFEYSVAPPTLDAMRAAARLVTTVSPERIRDELGKLCGLSERPSIGFELMRETGLLEFVLPELAAGIGVEQNAYHAYDVYEHSLRSSDAAPPGDLVLRFAALLHDIGKPLTKEGPHFYGHDVLGAAMARRLLERLRFSSDEAADIESLVRNHMYSTDAAQGDGAVRRFIRRVGIERLDRQFSLRHADIAGSGLPKRGDENERFEARVVELLARRPPLSEKDLALNGTDVIRELVAAGLLPAGSRGGPLVGICLSRLLEAVYDDPALNTPEVLTRSLRDEVSKLRGTSRRLD